MAWRSEFQLIISDIDCDRRDEFLFLSQHENVRNYIVLWDEEVGIASWQLNFSNEVLKPFCANLDQEGDLEVIVPEKVGDSLFLNVYTSEERQLQRFFACEGVDRNDNGEWDGTLSRMAALDLDGDGILEIVAAVHTSHDFPPRGIWAFDWKEGKEIWRFETGPQMVDIVSADLDGDGLPEIICSTGAPFNGSVANGTADSLSYVIVLDRNGHLLWKKVIGGIFSTTWAHIADFDSDGRLDIIAFESNSYPKTEKRSKINILDGKTGQSKRERAFSTRLRAFDIKDITNDGQLDIILLSLNGQVLVLDSQLERIMEFNDPQKSNTMLVEDLNNDGKLEVVLSNGKARKRSTVILDNELKKILTVFDDGGAPYSVRTNPGQPKRLALVCPDYLYFLDMKRNPGFYTSFWHYIFSGLIGVLAILFIIYLRDKLANSLSRLEPGFLDAMPVGFIGFDKKGTVAVCNSLAEQILNVERIRFVGKGYREAFKEPYRQGILDLTNRCIEGSRRISDQLQINIDGETKEILCSVAPLLGNNKKKRGTLLFVEDVTQFSQSRRAAAWAAMAQRLAHEIKNPLSTVMLTLQRLQMEYQKKSEDEVSVYDKYTDSILEEVSRLRTVSDGFMKFAQLKAPNLQPANINNVIKRTLKKYDQGIPDNIKLKAVLAEDLLEVKVDEEQVQTVLTNILENAMNAMLDGGALTVSTHVVQKLPEDGVGHAKDYVVIEIFDTGIGISQDNIEKLFDPFFSLSEGGTGLGLAIVKKIIDDHRGNIDVQSREGIGTTIIIELPV